MTLITVFVAGMFAGAIAACVFLVLTERDDAMEIHNEEWDEHEQDCWEARK